MLLLHAFPLDAGMWSAQLEALADRSALLAPDLPGFGRSGEVSAPPSLDALAQMIYEGSLERGVQQAVVVGCSMGGYLAFALVRVAPRFVRALALINTRAAADDEAGRAKRLALADRVEREGCGFLADEWPATALSSATVENRPDVVARVRQMVTQATPQGVIAAQRAMACRPDSSSLLQGISVPCTVVHGLDDPIIPAAEAQAMAASIKAATFTGIRAAGHLPSVEQPSLVNAALQELLERLS